MQSQDAKAFLATVAPFDRLDHDELGRLAERTTAEHYEPQRAIVQRWETPGSLFVIAAGTVEETDGTETIARLSRGDIFDSRALVEGRSQHSFVAATACTCLLVPVALVRASGQSHPAIREFFERDAARRADALVAYQQQKEAASLLMARIGDGAIRPPRFVGPETTMQEAVALMRQSGTSALLVRDGARCGIFTGRDVREQLVLAGLPATTAIGTLANDDLITLEADDFVFDALVVMTRKQIRHVVITRHAEIIGILEQGDLLNYLNNTTYAIATQTERAEDEDDLKAASDGIPGLIRSLYDRGVKPRYIARMVTDLNRKILLRLFQQLAPPALAEDACLMVMGSEGRGEQLLRTDQDNGMVFRGEIPPEGFAAVAEAVPQTLIELGYPPCAGNVMASNPQWAKSAAAYREDIFRWVHQPSADGFIELAVFFDAEAVAGDASLLADLKARLLQAVRGQEAVVRHIARAVQAFPTPLGLFDRFILAKGEHAGAFDIKKGGIFPIVHGTRTLALEQGVGETNTIARLQALSGRRPLGRELAADLVEAFDFMSMLRLRTQLTQLARGAPTNNFVRPGDLNRLERGLLRDSLKVVKQLKSLIGNHYRLDALA